MYLEMSFHVLLKKGKTTVCGSLKRMKTERREKCRKRERKIVLKCLFAYKIVYMRNILAQLHISLNYSKAIVIKHEIFTLDL